MPRSATLKVAVDANALDRKSEHRSRLVDRFAALAAGGRFRLFVGEGVRREAAQGAAAQDLRALLPSAEAPVPRSLGPDDHIARMRVRSIVQGNARPGKHEGDAGHLSEAAEAACDFFVTYDGRILTRREDLERYALPPTLKIVTLEEFLSTAESG